MKSILKNIFLLLFLGALANTSLAHTAVIRVERMTPDPVPSSNAYLDVINSLMDHIRGNIVLSDMDLANNHDLLLANMGVLVSDSEAVSRSFELIGLFEENYGPIFISNNTRNGFNKAYTSDGLNLHRNLILIHQALIDHSFTEEWIANSPELFDGKLFRTSQYFPGSVEPPADPEHVETATINCSYLLAKGSQPWANIGNPNTVRPTGCYLAPGSIAEITVPDSLVGKGLKIRVGAHFWDLSNKNNYKRMDRVSITFDINATVTKVAHPLGGGIYVELPLGVDEGIQEIRLKNVVRAPFYSKKTFHQTSLEDWREIERKHPAPWADFETDKFMMQVPTGWIYNFDDPESLMEDWDKSMDAVSDLLGRPRITDRHKNYLQFDVIIRGSAYHPGYPMSNTTYNPNAVMDGLPKHKILQGPQYDQDIHFHELGHEVAISKFAGETEALVNFLYVPVLNRCFGYSLDEAFQKSFGPSYNFTSTKENTVRTRLVANTFRDGEARNTCGCTKNEVRYQHRGYAHYVDIVELYGWEALENFWRSESEAADMGNPFPVNDQEQDDRIFRMSLAAGVDLRPLFHFWGIIPKDQDALAQRMRDNDLALPMDIKQKLHQYQALIPSDYDEFVEFGNELYPDFLNYSGNQFDFGPGWYQAEAQGFDENTAGTIRQRLSDIIIYYYGTDCFELGEFLPVEFSFERQYCADEVVQLLPTTSDNGILGSWDPDEVDTSIPGLFEFAFVPELDQCAVDEKVLIEVLEPVDVSIDVRDPLCFGDYGSAFFTPTGGSGEGYMFSIEGDSLLAGNYEVVVTDDAGCSESFAFELIEPAPITIEWVDNEVVVSGGTAPYTITVDTTGSVLTVRVEDANDCTAVADFILSSVKNVSGEQLRIFPNPAADVLHLDVNRLQTGIRFIQLVSLDGRDIQTYRSQPVQLDITSLGNGMYVLLVFLEDGGRIYKKLSVVK